MCRGTVQRCRACTQCTRRTIICMHACAMATRSQEWQPHNGHSPVFGFHSCNLRLLLLVEFWSVDRTLPALEGSERNSCFTNNSETESDISEIHKLRMSRTGHQKRKQSKLSYQRKLKYLMQPVSLCNVKSNDDMICANCQQQMKAKCSIALRHIA